MANKNYKRLNIISKLINQGRSGIITFNLPNSDVSSKSSFDGTICGILIGDPTISYANKWQTVLPNVDALTLASNIFSGWNGIATFIASTQAAWMGAEPLRLSVNFYLFTFNEKDDIDNDLLKFKKLQAPTAITRGGKVDTWSVTAHGGYKPSILEKKDAQDNIISIGDNDTSDSTKGNISITIGNCTITDLLLETVQEERSSVLTQNGNHLYLKVSANFRSRRVMYSDEIQKMFGK